MGRLQPHCRGNRSQWHRINHVRLSLPPEETEMEAWVRNGTLETEAALAPG